PGGTPAGIRRPQSGPIRRRPFRTARRLSSISAASGTWSLKRKTWSPRLSALRASAVAYGPGVEIRARLAPGSSARAAEIVVGGRGAVALEAAGAWVARRPAARA